MKNRNFKVVKTQRWKQLWSNYRQGFIPLIFISSIISIGSKSMLMLLIILGLPLFLSGLTLLFPKKIIAFIKSIGMIDRITEYFELHDNLIIVNQDKRYNFPIENLIVQEVRYKFCWQGIKLSNESHEIFIWKSEFDSIDWEEILKASLLGENIKERLDIHH